MKRSYLFLAAAALASTLAISAQDADKTPARPGNPIIAALDANGDGVLDQQEINNAPAALRKLDKDGDGKVTRQELRPAGVRGGAGQGNADADKPRKGKKNKNL